MNKAVLTIKGMHCEGCVKSITSLLEKHVGVTKADVSLEKEIAEVLFDVSHTTVEELISAIAEAGFEVSAE